MKTKMLAFAAAGASAWIGSSHTCPADRVPGLEMNPVEYQNRMETGVSFVPVEPTRAAAEEKMSSFLASLFNAGLRVPGEGVAEVKDRMLRLSQLREWETVPQGTAYGPVDTDLIHVYVEVANPGGLDLVRPWCFETPDEAADGLMLAGWIEEDHLAAVALLDDVRFVQPVDPPRYRTGSVTSAGDALHHGPQARGAPWMVDGSGIRVGVVSDGVANLPLARISGDLPPVVNVLNPGSGDEGTAMLEIIHDLAPGAGLEFCSSGSNQIAFANAVAALAQGGCNVICDDVGWYLEPFFEHSSLGQQIANLRTMYGCLHVSAAGNDAQLHHQQLFTDVMPGPPDGYHDPALYVNVPPGGALDVFMQWKESLASVPASDYDLYLFDAGNLTTPIAMSAARNRVGETIYYTNNTASAITAAVYVFRHSGVLVHDVEIFLEPQNGAVQYTNGTSPVDAIFGHPGHGAVIAAVSTDVASPAAIEWDSSQGPFTVIGVFQPSKPDVAAADGVAVTGAGGFPTPFFGTSAAAPHVAGVLALVWSRNPGVPAAALKASLMNACTDLGTAGFDPLFGWGRPLADQWANLLNMPPVIAAPSGTFECAQMIPEEIAGLVVSDPDAAANPVSLTLSASNGIVMLDPMIPGGLTMLQISNNGTPAVSVSAPCAAIQATLAAPAGLTYLANPVPPGTTVGDSLVVAVNDQGNTGVGGPMNATAALAIQAHQFAYDAWCYDHFDATQRANPMISGENASPDGDLHANVWEYFMGTDPWVADSERSTSVTISGGCLVLKFRVAKSIPGSSYAVRVSQDLVTWSDVPAGEITVPWPQHPTAPDAWLMEVRHPLAGSTKDFLRVAFIPRQ